MKRRIKNTVESIGNALQFALFLIIPALIVWVVTYSCNG